MKVQAQLDALKEEQRRDAKERISLRKDKVQIEKELGGKIAETEKAQQLLDNWIL